jgi:thiamine-monophosphate kinase
MTPGASTGGEFAVIDRLARRLPGPPAGEVWIGDDAAVLGPAGGQTLLTTDFSVVGVHADLALMGLDDLGWRAVAVAVSDIAAMGGSATHVLVAVAGPPSTDLDALYEGVAQSVAAHGCVVIGGDLSNATEVVVVVTVAGAVGDGPGPVLRSGARGGDHLFVSGPLGASAAGLRTLREAVAAGRPSPASGDSSTVEAYRRPRARLAEGEVARRCGATAMIDISDGLAADLGHLADASGVGFRVDRVPVSTGATVEEALGGGEDYELVFAAPEVDVVLRAFEAAGLRPPVVMGRCTTDRDQRQWLTPAVVPGGWEHRFR